MAGLAPDEGSSRCYCICSQGQPGSYSLGALITWCWNVLPLQDRGNSPEDWSVLLSLAQCRFSASEVQERTSRLILHLLWPPTIQLCMLSLLCFHFLALHPRLASTCSLPAILHSPKTCSTPSSIHLQVLCLSLLCLLWGPLLPQGQPSFWLASGAKQRCWDWGKKVAGTAESEHLSC